MKIPELAKGKGNTGNLKTQQVLKGKNMNKGYLI